MESRSVSSNNKEVSFTPRPFLNGAFSMAEMWYYTCEGKQMDPVTMKELKRLVGDGALKPTDMVWKEGMPRWIRASSVQELFPDPTAALDKYFTNAKEPERKAPQVTASTAPATKSSPAGPGSAQAPAASAPHADEEPQPKRRRSADRDADEDSSRPPRRRPEAKGSGSSIFIILFLLFGLVVLLGGLFGGVLILVIKFKPAGDQKPPLVEEKKEKRATPINGVEKYDVQIRPNDRDRRTFIFRQEVNYDISVKSQPNGPGVNVHLFVFDANGNRQAADEGAGPNRRMRWVPRQDGEYRVEVANVRGGLEVKGEVTIKELDPAAAKNEPLPKGVLEGQGVVTPPELIMPNGEHILRFRVKAGYEASVTATPVPVRPGSDLNIYVYKDNDPTNTVIASDTRPDAGARVTFTLQDQEIVRVRIHNASRKTTNRIQVIYNVSPLK
jgi:GYF domain 2